MPKLQENTNNQSATMTMASFYFNAKHFSLFKNFSNVILIQSGIHGIWLYWTFIRSTQLNWRTEKWYVSAERNENWSTTTKFIIISISVHANIFRKLSIEINLWWFDKYNRIKFRLIILYLIYELIRLNLSSNKMMFPFLPFYWVLSFELRIWTNEQ